MTAPLPVTDEVTVLPGPAVLEGVQHGPSLVAHLEQYDTVPRVPLADLLAAVEDVRLSGRGGAAFPFAAKLRRTADSHRRPVVVVNLAEGEPASSKDTALALTRPHLVLDGAVATARALRAHDVHLVLPGDRPAVRDAIDRAVGERRDRRVRLLRHVAEPRFVSGQSSAVLELLAGRANLPVTSWTPAAVSGHGRRPTLLSNAETWAHVGRLVHRGPEPLGTADEPGTTLLTIREPGTRPLVREVPYGTPFAAVLPRGRSTAVLVGGFHGTWARPELLARLPVSVSGLREAALTLGAGVVVPVDGCPVAWSQRITGYLAGESARRCGPCRNGLPALAAAVRALDEGGGPSAVARLADLVDGRGACAHPDGTARLVRSLLTSYAAEVDAHGDGRCDLGPRRLRAVEEAAS